MDIYLDLGKERKPDREQLRTLLEEGLEPLRKSAYDRLRSILIKTYVELINKTKELEPPIVLGKPLEFPKLIED